MKFVVIPAIVLPEEHFYLTPRAFEGFGVGPSGRVDEVDAVVDSPLRVTLFAEIAVSSTRIADDLVPDSIQSHIMDSVEGSVRNWSEECYRTHVQHHRTPTTP